MYIRKSKTPKVSMTISVALHAIAFFAFAFVKFYTDEDVEAARMPVAFVEQQITRVLKRSFDIRPMASLDESPQHRPTSPQLDMSVSHRTSSDFYVTDTPKLFSEVKSVGREMLQRTSLQRPSVDLRQNLVRPVAVELRESSSRSSQAQSGISGGHELFSDTSLAQMGPETRIITDVKSVLQSFLESVRKKIESNKKYPASARDAGIEGRSRVRMTILKNGRLEKVEIMESSGHEILDVAALQSVRDAAPFPSIPKEAGREKIELSIDLVFKIT